MKQLEVRTEGARSDPPAPSGGRTRVLVVAACVLLILGGSVAAFSPGARSVDTKVGVEVPATATDLNMGPANNSPLLLADPVDANFVALADRLDAPQFSCALQISHDAGATWVPATVFQSLPPGADTCYAPEIAFDRRGTLYYLFVGLQGQGNEPMGVFLTKSTDKGEHFSAPVKILEEANFGVRMAIDPRHGTSGRLYLVWLHATEKPPLGGFGSPPNPIMSMYSDDGALTFSTPVQVNRPEHSLVVAPALTLGPRGEVFVAFYDLNNDRRDYQGLEGPTWDGKWSVIVAESSDGGAHFDKERLVDGEIVPAERVMLIYTMPPPSIVAARWGVCVAWTDARFGDADVLLRCPEGHAPLRVNGDPAGDGHRQYLPKLGLAPNGRLDILYFDRSDGQNRFNDINYAVSFDHGRTVARNVRVTSNSSDVRIGQRYTVPSAKGQVEWGSRLGVLSRSNGLLAAWPDTRNSLDNSQEQDLFTTNVSVDRPHTTRYWVALADIAIAALLLVVFLYRSRAKKSRTEPVA